MKLKSIIYSPERDGHLTSGLNFKHERTIFMLNANTQPNTLILGQTIIRRDAEGRFCLNDCHKAGGNTSNKQPYNFIRLGTTQELMKEIDRSSYLRNGPVHIIRGGKSQGTYAVRELVYAYAMWISPAFNLTVIRAFDAMVSGGATTAPREENPVKFRNMASAFRQLMQVARVCGCTPRQAAERAAIGVEKRWGINPLKAMELLPESQSLFDMRGDRP